MKNKPITYKPQSAPISIKRYSLTIFIVITVVVLVFCILLLNNIMNQPLSNGAFSSTNGTTTFDQTTINRLNKYKTSDENSSDQAVPSGRINPFAE
ncbi:MAG TPA: hypothetical protein VFD55_03160 [Candidatus Angelobacter sp.]|nr:hypothetical protein [Candidatus Angelobacter sp.]